MRNLSVSCDVLVYSLRVSQKHCFVTYWLSTAIKNKPFSRPFPCKVPQKQKNAVRTRPTAKTSDKITMKSHTEITEITEKPPYGRSLGVTEVQQGSLPPFPSPLRGGVRGGVCHTEIGKHRNSLSPCLSKERRLAFPSSAVASGAAGTVADLWFPTLSLPLRLALNHFLLQKFSQTLCRFRRKA